MVTITQSLLNIIYNLNKSSFWIHRFLLRGDDEKWSLGTRVYFKPTDTHALLHKTSHHPKHTYRGIIKSQLIRFNRICARHEDVEVATGTLFKDLR